MIESSLTVLVSNEALPESVKGFVGYGAQDAMIYVPW